MHTVCRLVGALTFILATLPALSTQGQAKVRLTLSCDKTTVSLRETVAFDAALRNDGVESVFLYNRLDYGPSAGLMLRVEDSSGNVVESSFIADAVLPPPPGHDFSILVRLGGAQFFGTRLISSVADLVKRPGTYRFRVTYSSLLYPDLVEERLRGLNVLWKGHPPIVSPWVTIQVTP